jgi:signal transduction histidine kinase
VSGGRFSCGEEQMCSEIPAAPAPADDTARPANDLDREDADPARSRQSALPRQVSAVRNVPAGLGASLQDVVGAIAREFDAHAASLWLREPNEALGCVLHIPGLLSPSERSAGFKDDDGPAEIPFLNSLSQATRPVVLRDCARNPALQPAQDWFSAMSVETMLVIPIPGRTPGGAANAGWCLLFHQQSREYQPADLVRAAMRGDQLSLAIQVARAGDKLKESAIAAERNRIARELHDTLAQGFTSILLQIENSKALLRDEEKDALAALDEARDLARESLAEARRAIWAMRPRALDESDLPAALEGMVREMAAGSGVSTEFTAKGATRALTVEIETNLFRIVQEAVTNALRHARARAIRVRLVFGDDFVKVSVEDDGCGFKLRGARTGDGFGLISMRERAESLSGKLLISSHPARGTRILAKIPIPKT